VDYSGWGEEEEFSHIQSTHLLTLYTHSDVSIMHGNKDVRVYDFSKVISEFSSQRIEFCK